MKAKTRKWIWRGLEFLAVLVVAVFIYKIQTSVEPASDKDLLGQAEFKIDQLQTRINEITERQSEAAQQLRDLPPVDDSDPEIVAEVEEKRARMIAQIEQLEAAGNHGPAASIRATLASEEWIEAAGFPPNPKREELREKIEELTKKSIELRGEIAKQESLAYELRQKNAETNE